MNYYLLGPSRGYGFPVKGAVKCELSSNRDKLRLPDRLRPCFVPKKISPQSVISNLAAHAWSTKCRRKTKLIAQLGEKS